MPKDNQTDPRNKFVPLILPWLLGAVMLTVYCFTLNKWVTLLNLDQVARASGWIWQPQIYSPLLFLLTLPFHWLEPAKIPMALNLFSAICAALALVLLARSVTLLPQDRTEPQRQRERSDFSFITGWPACFPPILAVLCAGLQLAFWEHATNFTGDMVDLLLFAFIVWQLLEYRLDERPWRLSVVAMAYGAGIAETWAFIGFFPLFLAAIIWLKGLEFFNFRFLLRIILCGCVGLLLLLLLPLVAKHDATFKISLWDGLRQNFRLDWLAVTALKNSQLRHNLTEASLSTILPILVLAIRWSATFGDNSHLGSALANNMMHFVYAVIFSVGVWVTFDPPFSAGQLLNAPTLSLNYLSALSIGYFCGYFLLVFGKEPLPNRRGTRPKPLLPPALMWICPVIVAGTFVAATVGVGTLVYRNAPLIRTINDDTLLKFAGAVTQNLPKEGAILLCDSDVPGQDQPIRSLLIRAMLTREGRSENFPIVDTQSVNWTPYHRYLHKKYPDKWPLIVKDTDPEAMSPMATLGLLVSLSKSNNICYLNSSFGNYFEYFYQEPHGLVYPLKKLSDETLLLPPLNQEIISHNEAFWTQVTDGLRSSILNSLNIPDTVAPTNFPNWLLNHLHVTPAPNQNALWVGMLCSRSLNDWGVALQRNGQLEKAAVRFSIAREFNPENAIANINLAFNQTLRSGSPTPINLSHVNADQFGQYRNWNDVVTADGTFDEVSFCFEYGHLLMEDGLYRQAAQQFNRVRQLAPDDLYTRLQLAQIYLLGRLPDRARDVLLDPLAQPARFGLNDSNSIEINTYAAAIDFQKHEDQAGARLLEREVARHPDDDTLLEVVSESLTMHGLYTNALSVINSRLARSPTDAKWIFSKGLACFQMGDYDSAITAMSQVLEIQTNSSAARFNRALSYLNAGKLDQALADYKQLQTGFTNSFQIAYGLGEIATRQHNTNEAIHNFEIYLAGAPTNSAEYKSVQDRLTRLRGH